MWCCTAANLYMLLCRRRRHGTWSRPAIGPVSLSSPPAEKRQRLTLQRTLRAQRPRLDLYRCVVPHTVGALAHPFLINQVYGIPAAIKSGLHATPWHA